MKILHFADLHLDAPFYWAPRDTARRRRQSLRDTLRRILEIAQEERVDAITCGGDLYEHDRRAADTAELLRRAFAEVHPIRAFLAPGNHDFLGSDSIYRLVSWSDNVHVFETASLAPVELTLGLTLWGAAHLQPARTPGMLEHFRVDRGGVSLGLFHASEIGWLARQGSDKQPHAPFDEEQLDRSGLHHALLGHYHYPRAADRYTYPGNPDPLSFGEEGSRGAVILTVAADGTVAREWRTVCVSQIHDLELDVSGCGSVEDVRARAREILAARTGSARLTLRGELPPAVALEVDSLADVAPHMEHVIPRAGDLTLGYDLSQVRNENTVRGEFVRQVEASDLPDDVRQRVLMTGLRALAGRDDLAVL